ncbi:peptidase S66 [Lysinibacillus sphaericus]|uniref:S66 family peptidase n=1 Tax=Lysinibacillus sphaericus TaxID=1421 RepID=UPI0018CD6A6A|nr:S66 peptidase family protein [Lysinibacillus sphaericus]MBG9454995.1 peptidase S66 [Lysinibacillus sphaericus]MBG9478539.1 peptidase S66 [Lysinibacillus sphaericus]MBG9592266.1 peptidase S66 [Lysinibacillus sphaericus]
MRIPNKLIVGDEIRVIAPSRSAAIITAESAEQTKKMLEDLGFRVSFGRHIFECDLQHSSSIEHRVSDIHDAFRDENVKAILTVIGGFNCNEVLPYLDYDMIANNPKILCGFSDITALATAITKKCGFVTYSGPHFSSFKMEKAQDYQLSYFQKCLIENKPYTINASRVWSDDAWYLDQRNRHFEAASWKVYSDGEASGQLYGGNLCTLNLLQGTAYMPELSNSILFLEDDEIVNPEIFARDFTSLLQATSNIKGIAIGRFQRASNMTAEQLHFILDKHPNLKRIPVIYDVDFGHTQPIFTFPIGGEIQMNTKDLTIYVTKF